MVSFRKIDSNTYALLFYLTHILNRHHSFITMRVTSSLSLIALSAASVGNALSLHRRDAPAVLAAPLQRRYPVAALSKRDTSPLNVSIINNVSIHIFECRLSPSTTNNHTARFKLSPELDSRITSTEFYTRSGYGQQ